MRFLNEFRRAVHKPVETASDIQRDVDEELAFHLEMRMQRLREQGYSAEAAALEARRRFGAIDDIRNECVDSDRAQLRSTQMLDRFSDLVRDVRLAARRLSRSPGYFITTALLLALGIGGTTSVFSIVNAIYFRPLPYPNADRLVVVRASMPDPACGRRCARTPSMTEATEWRKHAKSLEALGTMELRQGAVVVPNGTLVLEGAAVSREIPHLLGLRAAIGRNLLDSDFAEGAAGALVLSHSAWLGEFAGDSGVVGQTAIANGQSYRIVGVLSAASELGPPIFSFNVHTAQYFIPRVTTATAVHQVLALRRDGASPLTTETELAALLKHATGGDWVATIQPLRDVLADRYRGSFALLLAAASVVLLLTCLNVGGLLVARLNDQMPELTTRAVLGADRFRLVQQGLTETGLISLIGTIGGLLLAYYGTRIAQLIPAERLPFWTPIAMDVRVVGVAIALALIGGAAIGAAPMLSLSPARIIGGLRDLITASPRRARFRGIAIITEVALSVALLGIAGILIKQLITAESRDLGSAKRSVVFVALSTRDFVADAGWPDRMIAGLRLLPGVTSASVSGLPAQATRRVPSDSVRRAGPLRRSGIYAEGRSGPIDDLFFPLARVVTSDYFISIGKPIVAGRAFNASDRSGGAGVAIIDDASAQHAFPGESAIGRRIRVESGGAMGEWLTIVGVCVSGDDAGRGSSLGELYRPWAQLTATPGNIAVHVVGDSRAFVPTLRTALRTLAPTVPVASISPIETWVDHQLWGVRFATNLLTGFALFGVLLACLGVYAMVSYVAEQRRREMAIRVAIGATRRDIIASVTRPAMRMMIFGILAGVVTSLVASRLLRSFLFGASGIDVMVVAVTIAAMLAAGGIAAYLPARRAASADPLQVLRAQ